MSDSPRPIRAYPEGMIPPAPAENVPEDQPAEEEPTEAENGTSKKEKGPQKGKSIDY